MKAIAERNNLEFKEFKEEIKGMKEEAKANREIFEELRVMISRLALEKGKEIANSDEVEEVRGSRVNVLTGGRGLLSKPTGVWIGNSSGSAIPVQSDQEMRGNSEGWSNSQSGGNRNSFCPKVKLANFGGEEPRVWLKKCKKYFDIFQVPKEQRVRLASLYFQDKANSWFQNWNKEGNVSWVDLEEAVCERFGDDSMGDIVEEFMKLRQETTVEEYLDRFEDLRVRMERFLPELKAEYFLSGFVGGLKDEI